MTEERVKTEVGKLEDVLNMIDRVNETFTYEVWVPSLNKNVMFREINTSQQKRLIKAIIDSPVYNTELIFTLRKVIQENCADTTVNSDNFTILDKLFIALKMRSVSVGDTLELNISLDDEGKTKTKRGISLDKVISDAKAIVKFPGPETITDDTGKYTLTCNIPSINTEYKLEDELRRTIVNREEIKNTEELRQTIGDVFIGELSKYINEISIKENNTITKVDLESLSFRNRIAIIEKLPEKVTKRAVEYIANVKKELDKVVLVKVNLGTEDDPKYKEEKIALDGSFFTAS